MELHHVFVISLQQAAERKNEMDEVTVVRMAANEKL